MAIDLVGVQNVKSPDGIMVQPIGARSVAQLVCAEAETAASAAELLAPFSYATAGKSRWNRKGSGITRAFIYARYTAAGVVTTDPVIRIYGAIPTNDTTAALEETTSGVKSSIPNDGTWKGVRLDNSDWNAAGLTLDLVTSGAGCNNDATYAYSDETVVIDLQDSWYWTVLVETAGSVTGADPLTLWGRLTA